MNNRSSSDVISTTSSIVANTTSTSTTSIASGTTDATLSTAIATSDSSAPLPTTSMNGTLSCLCQIPSGGACHRFTNSTGAHGGNLTIGTGRLRGPGSSFSTKTRSLPNVTATTTALCVCDTDASGSATTALPTTTAYVES